MKHEIRVDLSLGSQPRVMREEGDDRERSQRRVGCIGSGRRRAPKGKRVHMICFEACTSGERRTCGFVQGLGFKSTLGIQMAHEEESEMASKEIVGQMTGKVVKEDG
jgi:hypothetical protein